MSDRNLKAFLWDNGIRCETCKHFNVNAKIPGIDSEVCTLESNRQSGAYSGTLLRLGRDGACHRFEENEAES